MTIGAKAIAIQGPLGNAAGVALQGGSTPIGAGLLLPEMGAGPYKLSDGGIYLRSGTAVPAANYPAAAQSDLLKVYGIQQNGLPTPVVASSWATNGAGIFVVVSAGNFTGQQIIVSRDNGQSFQNASVNFALGNAPVSDVAWSAALNLFIAVGSYQNAILVSTSPDAVTWSQAATISGTTIYGPRIAVNGAVIAIAANQNDLNPQTQVWRSSNAVNWSQAALAQTISSNGIALQLVATGGRFFLVGGRSNGSAVLGYQSTDGTTWTNASLPDYSIQNARICAGGGVFLFARFSQLWTSTDLGTWTAITTAPGFGGGYPSALGLLGIPSFINGAFLIPTACNSPTFRDVNFLSLSLDGVLKLRWLAGQTSAVANDCPLLIGAGSTLIGMNSGVQNSGSAANTKYWRTTGWPAPDYVGTPLTAGVQGPNGQSNLVYYPRIG
ncbi:hypothetical protein [Chitinimonas sp.]|uniref:hypothetical protein n=1 Tax=Chitinimonas sp. TaxID=1934313 RepID=UPI0035AE9361